MAEQGIFQGRALPAEISFGTTEGKGVPEMLVVFEIKTGPNSGRWTVPIYFSKDAMEFSFERLRATGWTGKDLRDLAGIGTKDTDLVFRMETYQGVPRMKVEIAGGGQFKSQNPTSQEDFAARVAAIMAGQPGGVAAPTGPKPPF